MLPSNNVSSSSKIHWAKLRYGELTPHSTVITITLSEVYMNHPPVYCLHSFYCLWDNLRSTKGKGLELRKVLQAKLPK